MWWGWCNQYASFVKRVNKQPVTIRLINETTEFWRPRTPVLDIRPYNDIAASVDGAAVTGTDLYNDLVPALGPLVQFHLKIENPPQTIYDACSGSGPTADNTTLSDSNGGTEQLRGFCDQNAQGGFASGSNPTVLIKNNLDVFGSQRQPHLHVWGSGFSHTCLPADQMRVLEDCGCQVPSPQPNVDKPVNTRTGNFWTSMTDLAVQTPGPDLTWTRIYASQAITDTQSALSPGWQHPFAARLILPTMAGGEPNTVMVLSGKMNRLRFDDLGNGTYRAFPGIYSTLTHANGVYTQTLQDQQQLTFDATTGRLIGMRDALGRQLTLTYTGTPARLTRIEDASDSTRFLALTYATGGQIATVSDGTRTVQYHYDASGDLDQVTDVMGRLTTYQYQSHLLTHIVNALGQVIEQVTYDVYTPAGKVIHQAFLNGQQRQFSYTTSATTVTTTGADGRQTVEQFKYAASNTVTEMLVGNQSVLRTSFDGSFNPQQAKDARGNSTQMNFTPNGLPTKITNAAGQSTHAVYDSRNNLVATTDALGVTTEYEYNAQNQLVRITGGVTSTSSLRATTLYSYDANNRLLEQQSSDGQITRYAYTNTQLPRLVTQVTAGYQNGVFDPAHPDEDLITTYGYDNLGRLTSTTVGANTSLVYTDTTTYNADNTVAQTVQNYQNGVFDPAHPQEDLITTYGYDALGRQVWVKDQFGRYDAIHYNPQGQVDWTLRNLNPASFDSSGQALFQPYSLAHPDTNISTLYGYDGLGRTVLVTQTGILTGTFDAALQRFSQTDVRVTRTEYDPLSRPVTVTLNYRPGLPSTADTNVRMFTSYDAAGNVIRQSDALGRQTRTEYDALNRPIKITRNFENGDPYSVTSGDYETTQPSTDLISVIHYDVLGRVVRQIDNYSDGFFFALQPIDDRTTLYQYDTLGRVVTTTVNYDPPSVGFRTDTNRVLVNAYDPQTTRMIGQRDPLGRWVNYQYDRLGRAIGQVQNCRTSQGNAVAQSCAPFDDVNHPDRNVPSQTRYDLLGRAYELVDALGHVSHTDYDQLGRVITTTQNYLPGQPKTADTNVTSRVVYDVAGNPQASYDPLDAETHMEHDNLGRTVRVVDPENRETWMGYDGTGALRWTQRSDGQITLYQVDGLGRVTTTIANYQDALVGTNEPTDQDLITRTAYDAAGRQVRTVDPAGRVTAFAYDQADRLISVTENVSGSICLNAPCDVVTRYRYDRAGNRIRIVDARNSIRRFQYDAADQMVDSIDARGYATHWSYNAIGQVVRQDDPRPGYELRWSYDEMNRLAQTEEVRASGTSNGIIYGTTYAYDGLGRQVDVNQVGQHTTFAYDHLGRITQVQMPGNKTVGYGYDARGQRTQLTYPGGTTLSYNYFDDGQLQQVSQGSAVVAQYSYDLLGRLGQLTLANGAQTTYTYDEVNRLLELETWSGGTKINGFDYTLDRLGLRKGVTETLGTQTRSITYDYDGLLRLTSAVEVQQQSYTYAYDLAGNRTEVRVNGAVTESRSYNAANQVSGWLYDEAGNLLRDNTATYSYDGFSRVTRVAAGSQSRNYMYNFDGVLVNDGVMHYTQDLAAPLSQVLQATQGVTTTNYLYGLERLAAVSGSTRTWYSTDGLGSVRTTLNDAGAALGSVSYDPWGKPQQSMIAPFGFTGELQDSAFNLVNLRARWYHTGQGTFTAYRWQADESWDTIPYSHTHTPTR